MNKEKNYGFNVKTHILNEQSNLINIEAENKDYKFEVEKHKRLSYKKNTYDNKKLEFLNDEKTTCLKDEYIEFDLANKCYISTTILKNQIKSREEAFYFFACMNLLNAYVKKDYAENQFRKRYIIKEYVALVITQIIENNIEGIDIFIDKKLVYVKVFHRQFSFHNVSTNKIIEEFSKSNKNLKQEWIGIRLQPICVSILYEAIGKGIAFKNKNVISLSTKATKYKKRNRKETMR